MSLKSSVTRLYVIPQEATTGWIWLVPVVLFSLVFSMAARSPLESDLWWHLRAGEETWETTQPLLVDTFSHTRAGAAWINNSWLSQVGLYLLYIKGGYLALSAAVALLATLSMLLVYARWTRRALACIRDHTGSSRCTGLVNQAATGFACPVSIVVLLALPCKWEASQPPG
jgi:hypothetical protein